MQANYISSDLCPLDGQRIPIRRLSPLHQPKVRAAVEGDLDPGYAERMDAGAGVVVAAIGLMLDFDPLGLDPGFQVTPLSQ